MRRRWRLLILAAALHTTAGIAAAQTVIVRFTGAGDAVDVVLNTTTVGSTTASPAGHATIIANIRERLNKTEIDANLYFDTCPQRRRVVIAEKGTLPPNEGAGCRRRMDTDVFLIRDITTLVVDFSTPNPTVLLIQGRFDPEKDMVYATSPRGLIAWAGGGLLTMGKTTEAACGTANDCTRDRVEVGLSTGATYWVKRIVGVDFGYMRPRRINSSGGGEGYTFNTAIDADFLVLTGRLAGARYGYRGYFEMGLNRQRSIVTTTQTIDDIPASQAFRTSGWGMIIGAGFESWIKPSFAIYGDARYLGVKGSDIGGGQARIDDTMLIFTIGGRLAIGF